MPVPLLSNPSFKQKFRLPTQYSAFNTLPVELQDEIFSNTLSPFPHFAVDEGPLLISRVCRSWRWLALNTPKLWSSFEIELTGASSSMPSSQSPQIMNAMRLWLKRSKQYPLSVRLVHLPSGRSTDLRSAYLLDTLIHEAHRWRHIQFVMPSSNIAALHRLRHGSLPMLESCILQLTGSFDLSSLNIPWQQLTTLDLQSGHGLLLSLDKCLSILSQAERLERCTITSECKLDPLYIPANNISLPFLSTLHLILQRENAMTNTGVVDRPEASLVRFLNALSLPQLRALRLEWLVQRTDEPTWATEHSSFVAFLRGVAPGIRTLSLAYLPLTEPQLLECLLELPFVADLELKFSLSDIEHDPITDAFLAALTWPHNSKCASDAAGLLSSLQYLDLQCSGKRFADQDLLAFLESRRVASYQGTTTCRKFKFFHLFSMQQIYSGVERHAQKWSRDGMAVVIDSLVIR